MRVSGGLEKHNSSGCGERGSESRYILKVEPTGIAAGLSDLRVLLLSVPLHFSQYFVSLFPELSQEGDEA